MGLTLRLALIYTVLAASCVDGSFEHASWRKDSSEKALPLGVCFWRQGSLINHIPTGPAKAKYEFEARDPDFLEILGSSPKLNVLVKTDAHEGGVYYPDKDEFYFTTTRTTGANGQQETELKGVNLKTGDVTPVKDSASYVPNGMVLDNDGNLLVCQQGSKTIGGFIQKINLKTLKATVVADNWFGVPFNSPNDVVVKRDGSIWFTDPSYGSVQGFRSPPMVNNQVYRISVHGVVDAVADGFAQPNGLAFSPDEKRLYVTDTGFAIGNGSYDVTKPHSIYVFDVESDEVLRNRRLFASVGVYDGSFPGLGTPDGIKVDTKERVYVGTVDGVQVFSSSGKPLGLIRQPGVANMGFGGKGLSTLYIMNDTSISFVELKVKAAGLKYALKYASKS